MRICHVNLSKGFRGGERQTALLIQALAELGHQQRLVCRAASPLRAYLAATPNLDFAAAEHPLANWRAVRNFDLLHAHDGRAVHWCWLASLWLTSCRLFKPGSRPPYIITRRVPNPLKKSALTRSAYRSAATVVALSKAIADNLKAYDGQIKLSVIPSMCAHLPQDPAVVATLRQHYAGKYVVGHLGALVDKHKGQSYLIEAAHLLADQHPQLHFLLLGQGRDKTALKARAEGLDNVEFAGFKDNVGDYLGLFDLFAFPSLEEGLGSALLDVMEYRVPIIASDVDGIPDLIEPEVNGLLVPPADARALADAIARLYQHPEQAAKMAKAAHQRLPDYEPAAIAARYQALYQQLLNNE